MHRFHDKLIEVRDRVQRAAEQAGRPPQDITILAVSKTQSAARVREAVAAGQGCFGENYLQEALDKQAELEDLNIDWHFIGPIQSNKTKAIAEHFAWVHSLDRLKIAQRLHDQRPTNLPPLKVCLQINIDNEASKSGLVANQAATVAQAILDLPRLQLMGLMAIPAPRTDFHAQVAVFQQIHDLRDKLQQQLGHSLPTLSMGMSADLEAAIAAGATIVRIGTDLFGVRQSAATNR